MLSIRKRSAVVKVIDEEAERKYIKELTRGGGVPFENWKTDGIFFPWRYLFGVAAVLFGIIILVIFLDDPRATFRVFIGEVLLLTFLVVVLVSFMWYGASINYVFKKLTKNERKR